MRESDIIELYFQWMLRLVCNDYQLKYYEKLFRFLFSIEFTCVMWQDEHRSADGINLRPTFAEQNDINYLEIRDILMGPCSVLEMMIALAVRCEDTIMGNSDYGNRTGKWFWTMIDSLGLSDFDDGRFSEVRGRRIIDKFLERKYSFDGKGGLFYIPGIDEDLREVEIWFQLCWYLNTIND